MMNWKRFLLIGSFLGTSLVATPLFAQAPALLWSNQFSSGTRVFAITSETNVYVHKSGTSYLLSGNSGAVLASNFFNANPGTMQRDSAGYIYYAGVRPADLVISKYMYSNPPCFLIKYTAEGSVVWSNSFGFAGGYYGIGVGDLELDSAGNIYAAYVDVPSTMGHNSRIAKFDSAGNRLWQSDVPKDSNMSAGGTVRLGPVSPTNGFAATFVEIGFFGQVPVMSRFDSNGTFTVIATAGLKRYLRAAPVGDPVGDWYNLEGSLLRKRSIDAALLWEKDLGDMTNGTVGPDQWGGVHVASTLMLHRYDAEGNPDWSMPLPQTCTRLIMDAQGNRFFSADGGFIARIASENPPPARKVGLYFGNQYLKNGTYLFTNNPTLNIQSTFAGGTFFYTTNGAAPDFNGILYSGPFVAYTGSTVRAIGYSQDFTQSEEAHTVQIGLLPSYTLTVDNPGGGSVSLNPASGPYLAGSNVIATAVASSGWFFQKWLQDASGTNPIVNVTMTTNKTIKAVFATTLGATAAGGGTVLMSPPGGVYGFGTTVRLTGVPDAGKYFGFWGNAATGNTNPLYFNVVNPNQTVSSLFSSTPGGQAALTVLAMGGGRVTVSPRSNSYTIGQGVTLTAVPDAGQSFLNWGGDASGSANPLPITMNQSKLIAACFSGLSSNLAASGDLMPDGFHLSLTGEPGIFKVYSSSNLTSWQLLGYMTNTSGSVELLDPNTNGPVRFYRILVGP